MNADSMDWILVIVRKLCCCFLAAAMVLTQFGCASMPRPTPPAEIFEVMPWSIAPVQDDIVSYDTFHRKIAELKGNILTFHSADTAYAALSRSIDRLDDEQNVTEAKNAQRRVESAGIGALAGSALAVILVTANDDHSNEGYVPEFEPSTGAKLAIGALVVAGGALIGWLAAGAMVGSDVTPEQARRLNGLIAEYNRVLRASTAVRENSTD